MTLKKQWKKKVMQSIQTILEMSQNIQLLFLLQEFFADVTQAPIYLQVYLVDPNRRYQRV
jgi:hypothetical protein